MIYQNVEINLKNYLEVIGKDTRFVETKRKNIMMTALDFKNAKGKKVYFVYPYNFNFFSDGTIRASDEDYSNGKIGIYELTVKTCGDKRATFTIYNGSMSKTSVYLFGTWFNEHKECFATLHDAIAYAKQLKTEQFKKVQIFKRHAFISDYLAYKADNEILLEEWNN